MDSAGRGALISVILVCVSATASGCGGGGSKPAVNPFAYDRTRPLTPMASRAVRQGAVDVRRITYETVDGTRVSALLATPASGATRGCLMYQPGIGAPKEAAAPLWPRAARLGLGMFTIDIRGTGTRANVGPPIAQIQRSAGLIVTALRENVIDLRRGLDYLETVPACRHNIGYLGTSLGSYLGVLFVGADTRVRTAVLTSVGATWRARAFFSGRKPPGVTNDPGALAAALRKLSPFDPARWVAKISPRPVMLVEGLNDPTVPPVDEMDLAAAARQPKTVLYHRGGHDPWAPPYGSDVARRVGSFLTANLVERSGS